ncbi:MAG: flagellar hook-basal body complex protein FliE [Fibrobacteres bacterium]|jgi:flagellar hook-basal body complex protein FliE|nr:flagellar hook-basal body complex protein FliE [Fibrobacterota bacterium]
MDPIQRLSPGIAPTGAPAPVPNDIRVGDTRTRSFEDTLKGFLGDVNSMQNEADASIEKFVAGEVKDVHQVMAAVSEARTSFNLMLEIRNKTLEAYQELMRMQV